MNVYYIVRGLAGPWDKFLVFKQIFIYLQSINYFKQTDNQPVNTMKRTNLIYWIVTGIFCLFMLFSSIPDIMLVPDAKTFMHHLGYPDYFTVLIGLLKVLGVIALLIPGYPRVKEWAYAGFFFDLTGAVYSQVASDGFMPQISFMLLPIAFWLVSYIYFHKRLQTTA